MMRYGEIFWVELAGAAQPCVVTEREIDDAAPTTWACVLSATEGDVRLAPGEGGLPDQRIVVVPPVQVEKRAFGARLGALSSDRMDEIRKRGRLPFRWGAPGWGD